MNLTREERDEFIEIIDTTISQIQADLSRALREQKKGKPIVPQASNKQSRRWSATCPICGLEWRVRHGSVASQIEKSMCGYCAQAGFGSELRPHERHEELMRMREALEKMTTFANHEGR